ncbi:MAG: class I SAM-dependent methyltransferase [Candidatus Omnitrophota bacterium]
MGRLISAINPLHKKTKRDYTGRMANSKAGCMKTAREYGKEYWDGERRYGYGGYRYDGRWSVVAERLKELYGLPQKARILDVGCGKGFLLYEFKKLLPLSSVMGFDVSKYAIENAKEEIRESLFVYRAEDKFPFKDGEFDLVISITTLHNLLINDLKSSLKEIERVGKYKYIAVESYRTEEELTNLQCWALTCEGFFRPEEWIWLFNEFGYKGDYEFIYFD